MSEIRPAKALPQDARAIQGVWLFILTLGVFFFSSILLFVFYVFLRLAPEAGQRPESFFLPRSFVPSTILLIGVSGALEWAMRSARKDRSNDVRIATVAALIMGLLFMLVQSEGMYRLLIASWSVKSSRNSAYALTLVLAFVHAVHVVGGIVGLCIATFQANRDRYDHERHFGLRFCTLYWHFLDVVWIVLMVCFIVTGVLINAPVSEAAVSLGRSTRSTGAGSPSPVAVASSRSTNALQHKITAEQKNYRSGR